MQYYVWRTRNGYPPQLVAQTRFLSDASDVLENWASGYIAKDGKVILEKA